MTLAIFGIVGVIAGASLQYFFTRHLEGQRHKRDMKTQAYKDYLHCVAEHARFARRGLDVVDDELASATGDAKARVCLYGSGTVISAYAEFERLGSTMVSQDQRSAFIRMIIAMREDSGIGSDASERDLEAVLLGFRDGAAGPIVATDT